MAGNDDAEGNAMAEGDSDNAGPRSVPAPPSDAQLAAMVHGLADAVCIADHEGRITLWNKAAERLLGWTAAEALGHSLDLIIPERQRDRHWAGYVEVMRTGLTSYGDRLLEVPALHRDGHRTSIAFTVTLVEPETPDGHRSIVAVMRDDVERRELKMRVNELEL